MTDATAPQPAPPPHWEADVVVADGGIVHLRPILASDAQALVAFHGGLSPRTRYLRFFSAYPRIPERDLIRFTQVDHHDRVALVAELGGQIIAVGRYESTAETDEAEVAFVVADEHQGRGIGSVLLEHLAAAARESGVARFHAVVLAENIAMIRVFRDAGYETTRHHELGEVTLEFAVDETAMTHAVMREREQRAEARSIARLLSPSSVAVVGASNDPTKIGNAIFGNLLRMGFTGTLYPVNAESPQVSGVDAYPSVLDVPASVDLAVVSVPARAVHGVVEQCAVKGVRGLVVISGGFGERGDDEGRNAQRALVSAARSHGMRVVGPNCLGVVNTNPAIRLNASLAPLPPLLGRAGFFCQSGALGVAILGEAARRGIGVSTFVSAGNRADVSGNDLLQYWETDEDTDLVLLYLESFGNPRKFARLARRLGRRKPIVAVKSGRGGSVVPGLAQTSVEVPEISVRALFEAAGVIRVETLGGLFDVALLLSTQPLPPGDRVAVVSNSTALSVLVTNALPGEGLQVATVHDVGVNASAEEFRTAMAQAVADPDVDALVVVFVPPLHTTGDAVAEALRSVALGSDKPLLSTFLGFEGIPGALAITSEAAPGLGAVPSYPSPERAVRALGRATRYAAWRRRPESEVPELHGIEIAAARAVVDSALDEHSDGTYLDTDRTIALLLSVGIDAPKDREEPGVEVQLTVFEDRSFGALVSFGVAGVATDLLGDRAYAAVPLTAADADDLIEAPRASPILHGYGGGPTVEVAALADLALRLSALGDAVPEVADLVLTVLATDAGAYVQAASVRVAPPTALGDTGPRRLRGL